MKLTMAVWLIVLLLAMLVIPAVGSAQTADTFCNLTTGQFQERVYNNSALIWDNNFSCPFGCANNQLQCNYPAEPEQFGIVGGIFGFTALGYIILAFVLPVFINDRFNILRILYLGFGILFMFQTIVFGFGFSSFMINDIEAFSLVGIQMGLASMILTVVVFVFSYLFELLDNLMHPWKKQGRRRSI